MIEENKHSVSDNKDICTENNKSLSLGAKCLDVKWRLSIEFTIHLFSIHFICYTDSAFFEIYKRIILYIILFRLLTS